MKGEFFEFEVRWSDIDANRHMANSAYVERCIDCRVHFFNVSGVSTKVISKDIGPVIFHEHYYFIKEMHMGEKAKMNMQLKGNSEDYRFVEFEINLYKTNGDLAMYSTLIFTLMDLNTRKIVTPTKDIISFYDGLEKAENYKVFDPSYTRAKDVPYGRKISF
ncbi:MAG: thioesterase family protein [Bacteroidota bacterium]